MAIRPPESEIRGNPCFFVGELAHQADLLALIRTSYVEDKPCVQGYTNIRVYPARLYIVGDAPADHEFLHYLFYLNYPTTACPSGYGMQYGWIEHGGPCDPFVIQP